MSEKTTTNRRFVVIMLLLLVPIATGLLFVTTMQKRHQGRGPSRDGLIFSTVDNVSFWGGHYRHVIQVRDTRTGLPKNKWTLEQFSRFSVSNDGEQIVYCNPTRSKSDVFLVERSGSPRQITLPDLNFDEFWNVHWEEGDTRLFYPDTAAALRRYDIATGKIETINWKRPANENFYYWETPKNLIWVAKDRGVKSFQLIGNELRLIGDATDVPFHCFIDDGTRVVVVDRDLKSCLVLDVATGDVITRVKSDGRDGAWRAAKNNVVCFYAGTRGEDGAFPLSGAQIFDGESGKLLLSTEFETRLEDFQYSPTIQRFVGLNPSKRVETFDLNGRKMEFVPGLFRWWWHVRILGIALAVVWWLVWSLKQRRNHRSLQPLIDIAILHVVVFVCSGVRLWAYVYSPYWSGSLHVWESVAFLGTGLSMVAWFLLWAVFGSQRWSIRVGALVFAVATVLAVIILIWDAGSEARNSNTSMARAQTIVGTMTNLPVQLGIYAMAHAFFRMRLSHTTDAAKTLRTKVKRRITIKDLFIWMVSFGVLFTMITLRDVAIPKTGNIAELLIMGSMGALSAVLTIWLGLGSTRWRFLAFAAGCALVWWQFDSVGRMEIMHVGVALLPMILVSTMVLRWNGYRLKRC